MGRAGIVIAGTLLAGLAAVAPAQSPPPGDPSGLTAALILPRPFASGSSDQRRELAEVHAAVAAATPAQRAQAAYDDVHEDPSLFDATIATGFALDRLPVTWALLKQVQAAAEGEATLAKDTFQRTRPWGDDPRLVPCEPIGTRKPTRSYPSGHAMLGWSVGAVLAELLPDRAPAILARARTYARERMVCAEHYPSDVEASHVLAAMVVMRLDAQPAFQTSRAAAREELKIALARAPMVAR